MAVEEIGELCTGPEREDLRAAADTALTALGQLGEMFTANRQFSRNTERARVPLSALLARASRRASVAVDLASLAELEIEVVPAMAEHAFALLLEVLGADLAGKKVAVTAEVVGDTIAVTLTGGPAGPLRPHATDLVTIAMYALGRDHGELRCSRSPDPQSFLIRLPA